MQPQQNTVDKALMVVLVILNRVFGDIFVSDRFLRLTCFGSECTISKTEHVLQCKKNGTCLAIFWKQNDNSGSRMTHVISADVRQNHCKSFPWIYTLEVHFIWGDHLTHPWVDHHWYIPLCFACMYLLIINFISSLEYTTLIPVEPNQEHYGIARSVSSLLMPWNLESPRYQGPRYQLYMIIETPFSTRKEFNCAHNPSLEE